MFRSHRMSSFFSLSTQRILRLSTTQVQKHLLYSGVITKWSSIHKNHLFAADHQILDTFIDFGECLSSNIASCLFVTVLFISILLNNSQFTSIGSSNCFHISFLNVLPYFADQIIYDLIYWSPTYTFRNTMFNCSKSTVLNQSVFL